MIEGLYRVWVIKTKFYVEGMGFTVLNVKCETTNRSVKHADPYSIWGQCARQL